MVKYGINGLNLNNVMYLYCVVIVGAQRLRLSLQLICVYPLMENPENVTVGIYVILCNYQIK